MAYQQSVIDGAVKTLSVLAGVVCFPATYIGECVTSTIAELRRKHFAKQRHFAIERNFARERRRKERRLKEFTQAVEEKKQNQPKTLPSTRRDLSIGPTEPRERQECWPFHATADGKIQAALLRLPMEIRQIILIEALGGRVIHLIQCRQRLGHVCCKESDKKATMYHSEDPHYDLERECIPWPQRRTYHASDLMYKPVGSHYPYLPSENCLNVLRTCRQLYNEGTSILYSTNTFDVNNPETLVFLAQTIRPRRLKAIKYLQVSYADSFWYDTNEWRIDTCVMTNWVNCWKTIGSQMTGVKSLVVKFEVALERDRTGCIKKEGYNKSLLEVVRHSRVKGLMRFNLEIQGEDIRVVKDLEQSLRGIVCVPDDQVELNEDGQ